jgi:hypothetical protein
MKKDKTTITILTAAPPPLYKTNTILLMDSLEKKTKMAGEKRDELSLHFETFLYV